MAAATLTPAHVNFVCQLVKRRSAIELDENKTYLIEARLAPVAKQAGCNSISDLVAQVQSKRLAMLEERIVEAMTTNETSFFRDVHPFEALRQTLIPELLVRNQESRLLNIWSAACSTGQEIYSIAILLREHFPQLANWCVKLLGTDLSTEVLEKAKAATYTQIEVNRGLPAIMLAKYFQRVGLTWQLRRDIAAQASFLHMNLIERWPALPKMDIVFLRNVLIYFPLETKREILRHVRQVLVPGGVLFLGSAETTLNVDPNFERQQIGSSVFYRLI
jgi:chemotaxis protein methyltransferase CheR